MSNTARKRKVGHFARMVGLAFKTGPRGERLFCAEGLWMRPFVLRSEEQAERIRSRLALLQRLWFIAGMLLAALVKFVDSDSYYGRPLVYWSVFVGIAAAPWIIRWLVIRKELQGCERLANRLPLSDYYGQAAEHFSTRELSLLVLLWMFLAAVGLFGLAVGYGDSAARIVLMVLVALLALAAVPWVYMLYVKLVRGKDAVTS